MAGAGAAVSAAQESPFATAADAEKEVYGLVERIESLANRLVGPVPLDAPAAGQVIPAPVALFSALESASYAVKRRVRDGHEAVERILQRLP